MPGDRREVYSVDPHTICYDVWMYILCDNVCPYYMCIYRIISFIRTQSRSSRPRYMVLYVALLPSAV